ncbi:MAG: hypothetical protein FWD93_03415, partial [Coriobacteriia bacterium]|nr:hypothetical protein [Coriobacteriia bacterium]
VLGFEDLASRAHALAAFVNLPSFLLVVAAYGFFGNAEPEIPQFFIYVQAFIPAVLMYAGLRLKMQRQGKAEDLPAEDLSAACEQAATSEVSAADDVKSYLEEKRKELEQS